MEGQEQGLRIMNKITFESVMEEIKKSLGDARLKSINEYVKTSDDESGPRKDAPGFKATPEPSGDSLYDKSGSQDNAPKAATPAPAPKPEAPTIKPNVGNDIVTGPGKMAPIGGIKPEAPKPAPVAVKPFGPAQV